MTKSGVKRKDFKGPKRALGGLLLAKQAKEKGLMPMVGLSLAAKKKILGMKVGKAVSAGSQSGMGRLEKSGLSRAKKGKMMIMIAVGKPKKANTGEFIEPPMPKMRRIKSNKPPNYSTEFLKKKKAYDVLSNDGERKVSVNPPVPKKRKKMSIYTQPDYEYMKKKKAYDILTDQNRPQRPSRPIKKSRGGDAKIKKVIKGLKKASKLHAGQAKSLSTIKLSKGGGAAIRGTNFTGVF